MTSPILDTLAATPILVGLNLHALTLLQQEGSARAFTADEVIVREGEAGHSLFIIISGDVDVVKRHDTEHSVHLARLHAGTFFGEMCVVDPVPRAATVIARGEVTAFEITSGTLYHLYRQMPDQYSILILNVARDMARRLRQLDEAFAARAS